MGGGSILYVLFVPSPYRNVSVLLIVLFFSPLSLPLSLSSGSWIEEGQLTRQGRQTNKQTEGIKLEKNRADEMWRCVFIAVRLMACSSHYSLLCPLPPIGCNNTAWHGCQCHVISYFCLTTQTTRATSHRDHFSFFFFLPYFSGSRVCSGWQRSFTLDLIENNFSKASVSSNEILSFVLFFLRRKETKENKKKVTNKYLETISQ